MTALIAVTSGTNQVGKSILSANLAHYLNEKGHRTGLLEAGSHSPLWNIQPKITWTNILNGRIPLGEAIHRDLFGVDLMVTQGHGHALCELSGQSVDQTDEEIRSLDDYAYLIVDMAAGINAPAMAGCLVATETLMVITPDTPTLAAAYEWLIRLTRHGFGGPVNIVLNKVKKPALAQSVFMRFKDLAQKKINIQCNLWGTLPEDAKMPATAAPDQPLGLAMPSARIVQDIHHIGDRLLAEQPPENQTTPLNMFWRRFIDELGKLPVMPITPQDRKPSPEKKTVPEPIEVQAPSSPADNISEALQSLTQQLTSIATELGAIRKLLEAKSPPPDQPLLHGEAIAGDEITLDFDAFVEAQLDTE